MSQLTKDIQELATALGLEIPDWQLNLLEQIMDPAHEGQHLELTASRKGAYWRWVDGRSA